MADTEQKLRDHEAPEMRRSGEPDYPTVEPREDDNPHYRPEHDPPNPEQFEKS